VKARAVPSRAVKRQNYFGGNLPSYGDVSKAGVRRCSCVLATCTSNVSSAIAQNFGVRLLPACTRCTHGLPAEDIS
jgi:hypothetical protein